MCFLPAEIGQQNSFPLYATPQNGLTPCLLPHSPKFRHHRSPVCGIHCPENVLEDCGNRSSSAASPCSSPEPAGSWPQWGWTCHTHSLAALVNDTRIIAPHCCQYLAGQGPCQASVEVPGLLDTQGDGPPSLGTERNSAVPRSPKPGEGREMGTKGSCMGTRHAVGIDTLPRGVAVTWGQSPKGRSEMSFHSHAELGLRESSP